MDVLSIYLGDRLGYYRALVGGGLSSADLAERTGTAERYAREWLEQQAVTGILTVTDDAAGQEHRYPLPAGPAEALTDELSPSYLLPLARVVAGQAKHLDALVGAYRSGSGVSWAEFGPDAREAQAAANRPMFLGALGSDYLPSIPDVHAALVGGGRVADVGCGFGWSSIGIALEGGFGDYADKVTKINKAYPARPSTGSTSTSRRSMLPARMPSRPGSPTECASIVPTQ